jgi:hypothetical protein
VSQIKIAQRIGFARARDPTGQALNAKSLASVLLDGREGTFAATA